MLMVKVQYREPRNPALRLGLAVRTASALIAFASHQTATGLSMTTRHGISRRTNPSLALEHSCVDTLLGLSRVPILASSMQN